jgi:hypothetical protein
MSKEGQLLIEAERLGAMAVIKQIAADMMNERILALADEGMEEKATSVMRGEVKGLRNFLLKVDGVLSREKKQLTPIDQ